jgi:hypothetical protein
MIDVQIPALGGSGSFYFCQLSCSTVSKMQIHSHYNYGSRVLQLVNPATKGAPPLNFFPAIHGKNYPTYVLPPRLPFE